jgi:pyridoxal phosphate phosphatase PHOSPHO2
MKRRILFALDFDFTIIDEDSDHWVFKKLSPELFERMSGSKMQWTDLCNMLFMELQDSFSMEQIASTLAQIPFVCPSNGRTRQ